MLRVSKPEGVCVCVCVCVRACTQTDKFLTQYYEWVHVFSTDEICYFLLALLPGG